MHRKTWILALIAAGLVATATSVAFEPNPLNWFANDPPHKSAAGGSTAPAASTPLVGGPFPNHRVIVQHLSPDGAAAGARLLERKPNALALLILRDGERLFAPVELGS